MNIGERYQSTCVRRYLNQNTKKNAINVLFDLVGISHWYGRALIDKINISKVMLNEILFGRNV